MKIRAEEVGQILQNIYDSEIDIAMAWLYDGGLTFAIENKPYPLVDGYKTENIVYTGETDITKAIKEMCDYILEKYPDSSFSKWYKTKGW